MYTIKRKGKGAMSMSIIPSLMHQVLARSDLLAVQQNWKVVLRSSVIMERGGQCVMTTGMKAMQLWSVNN